MTPRITAATAMRVFQQLRRDRRTIAMLLVVPSVLMTLLKGMLEGQTALFNDIAAPMLGMFPFIIMFLVTSVTMLRERTSGTLERLMAMPLGKLDLLAGYGIAFGVVGAVQATVTAAVAFGPLGVHTESAWLVVVLAAVNAVLGMALGLFVSAFASTEFQAVQFMPAVVLPQILLCGLLVSRDSMSSLLQWLADLLPLTYAYDALARVESVGTFDSHVARDMAVVVGYILLALALGAVTLRRRTA
ncbi:MAG: ABC transporter permease [Gaiellales bacterium]